MKMKYLESTHKPPPTCSDGIPSWHSGKETAASNVVFIYHDETIFANDAPSQGWHDDIGNRQLRPKGRGKLTISDFVEEYNGFLSLTDEEFQSQGFGSSSRVSEGSPLSDSISTAGTSLGS